MEAPGGGFPAESNDVTATHNAQDQRIRWRNLSGFWILGLCNNFSYVIMLSAAHDILSKQDSNSSSEILPPNATEFSDHLGGGPEYGNESRDGRFDCSPLSTAAILLADILPTLLIKFCSPFVIHLFPYGYRVLFCCLSAITSFLVISFSIATWMSLLGVVFASISSGLGEYTFLSLTAHFQPSVICAWSSGTGAAGLLGAVSYSGLTQTGLSPRNTMQLMVVFPVVEWISYYCLLALPPTLPNWRLDDPDQILHDPDWTLPNQDQSLEDQPLISSNNPGNNNAVLTLSQKMKIIKNSLKYTIPLGLVYFAEYFINQGLFELLYFQKSFLNHSEQYRWYQTTYQAGVFISRSSRTCIHIRRIWVISILQFVNLLFLLFVAWYSFLPSIWIMFAIILYEGLLGGAGYVNAFNNIRDESGEVEREFAMGAASVADTLGIAVSGVAALPFHNWMCSLH